MIGIKDVGSYIPAHRIQRQKIGEAWGYDPFIMKMLLGEKAVANYDEDALTMASESVLLALEGRDASKIGSLYFASTTAPYLEKNSSSTLAEIADLPSSISTIDFANSLRAGTSAMLVALNGVKAGAFEEGLVVASDVRLYEPESIMETMSGDASAAVVVGEGDDVIAEFEGSYLLSQELLDYWRKREDKYIFSDDEKAASIFGYLNMVPKALEGLAKKLNLTPDDVSKIIVYASDANTYRALAKRLGNFAVKLNQDPTLLLGVGNPGVANVLLQCVLALEEANPGERIILISYGDGAEAFSFRVTEAIEDFKKKGKRSVRDWLGSKIDLPYYTKVLKWREEIVTKKGLWPAEPYTSVTELYREKKTILSLYGVKCKKCGSIYFPPKRVCPKCGAIDEFEPFKLSRRGKIVTFTRERAIPNPEHPVGMAVVDFEGGGRTFTQLTDMPPEWQDKESSLIDKEVELTFRIFHRAKGFYNYYWKARPVRGK